MEALRIYLFGGFLLQRGNSTLPPIASRAGRSLFAHLVMQRDRPLQRDLLAGTFWPELPDGRARRRLSHTLWQIQDVVNDDGTSHLSVTSDTLWFDSASPYWLDVEEFDRLYEASPGDGPESGSKTRLDAAALRSCVELYRGDFMAGFFDDWVVVDQDHYRQRYLMALRHLVDATKAEGDYEEALAYARRLTHHDPLSEDVHREVMRLCFLLGRTGEAVEQFDRCRSVLAEDLDAEPSSETVQLYERIVRQRRAGIRPLHDEESVAVLDRRTDTPFVGREEERRSLVDHMEKVLAGPGGVVLLEGEPGIGKTRLALEAAEDARWRGFEVTWGTCAPGAVRPFGPLAEVLESLSPLRLEQLTEQVSPVWLGEALRLAPELGRRAGVDFASTPLRPTEESTRMREALVHTMGALGDITPHLIIIDDVQWADRDTLGVITQLGPRLAASRILLLLLYRSEEARGDPEVWDMLRDGDRVAGLGRVVLAPLSVFEIEEMVKRILGLTRLEPAIAAQLHRQTGGNALFSLETLLAFRDRGLFDAGRPADVLQRQLGQHAMPVAPRVRSVIDERMSLLAEDALAVYEFVAVCGHAVELGVLSGGIDLARSTVLECVDELLHRGLMRDEGEGRYRITHDQVRQVVYDGIEPLRRVELHRRVAETLAVQHPDDVEAIGHHYWEGGAPAHAATHLREAGRRAMGLNAYATAAQHLKTASTAAMQAQWPSEKRYQILGELEGVLSILGRRDEQQEALDEMAALADALPGHEGDIERRRAWLLAHTADFAGAERAALRSVAIERERKDSMGLASSLVALGTCLRWSGRPLEAVVHLEEAVTASENDPHQRADALTELGSTLVEVQRASDAMPHLDHALAIYEELEDLRGQAEVAGIQGRALHSIDVQRARSSFQRAIDLCRQTGYRHGEGVNTLNLGLMEHMLGRVADALPGYDRAASIFDELGNIRGKAMVLANSAWARQALLGDYERAELDARKAMSHFVEIGDRARQAQCMEIIAGVAARQGRLDDARHLLERSLDALGITGNRFLEAQHLRSLALLQLQLNDPEQALHTLSRADPIREEAGLEGLSVELDSIRGMAYLTEGRPREAYEITRKAVDALRAGVERPYLVYHRHALAAKAHGQTERARAAAIQARDALEDVLAGLSAEQRESAIVRVPEHRAIMDEADRYSPSTVVALVPAADAPIGRALEAPDLRQVIWTVTHPDDQEVESPIERRQMRLLRLLKEAADADALPAIEHLADALGVSASTVRRDLDALREAGHRITTRGTRQAAS